MDASLRLVGIVAVAVALGGAAFAAFSVYDQDPSAPPAVELSGPDSTVSLLDGSTTTVTLQAENNGTANESLNLSSPTEAFTYQTAGPVNVSANDTATIQGTLTVEPDNVGENQTVEVVAKRAETGEDMASTSFQVDVVEPEEPILGLTANVPAALPGGEVTLQGTVENTMEIQRQVNLTVEGLQGTVEPASTQIAGNQTSRALVTATVPSDASGTATVTLKATTDDGQTATADAQIPVVGEGDVQAGAILDDISVRPGSRFAVPVMVVSHLDQAANVTASGPNVAEANITDVEAVSTTGGFVTIQTPEDASSAFTETITLEIGDETRTVDVRVDPNPEGPAAEPGKQVRVDYVGRLANDKVFDTSVPAVAQGPFPKADQFQARSGLEPIEIPLNPQRPGVVQGFYDTLVNMSAGESVTAELSPTEAYGPPRTHENQSATEEIQRVNEVPRMLEDIPTQQLPPDFNISDKEEGDTITYTTEQGGETITFRFKLTRKGEQTVDLERLADIGETTTFYPPWPNATEVVDKNETTIFYETTPPEDIGNFTWDVNPNSHQAKWENATTVDTVNETTIVLRFQPEEGLTYEASSGPRSPPSEYRVEEVGPEEIHVSTPNDHPLAGQTLTFDVTMHGVEDAPQRRGPMIGGGR